MKRKHFWVGLLMGTMSMSWLMMAIRMPQTYRLLYGGDERIETKNIVTEAVGSTEY